LSETVEALTFEVKEKRTQKLLQSLWLGIRTKIAFDAMNEEFNEKNKSISTRVKSIDF